jgi:hypothetical protein
VTQTLVWKMGFSPIYFTSDYSNPTAHVSPGGYHNIKPGHNPYDGLGGNCCTWTVVTSSNVNSGCASISGSVDMYYTPYSGGSGHQRLASYTFSFPAANTTYGATEFPFSFTELDDVNNVQYKVTSIQAGITRGTVATPYL